jgi:ABC-type Na+ efflux pump permease subunit
MRRLLISFALAVTLAAPFAALPSDTYAQRSVEQDGLVNVFAADLIDVENVNVAVVAQVIAAVCPAVTANVAAIATQVDQTGTAQNVDCPTTGAPITISQNNPGRGRPESPPGRVSQDGLVNVFAADLIDVRDVNATVAAQIVAAVCPAVTANVAAIVSQVDQSGTAQDITCPTTGAPIAISQNNPGRGR